MKEWTGNSGTIWQKETDNYIEFSYYDKPPQDIWLQVMIDALNVYEKTGLLASQVEQATLDKAAKVFDDYAKRYRESWDWSPVSHLEHRARGLDEAAITARKLKDSND